MTLDKMVDVPVVNFISVRNWHYWLLKCEILSPCLLKYLIYNFSMNQGVSEEAINKLKLSLGSLSLADHSNIFVSLLY